MNVASVLHDLGSKYHVEICRPVTNFMVSVISYTGKQETYIGEGSTIEAALEDLLKILALEEGN